jgi:hypothetical protein
MDSTVSSLPPSDLDIGRLRGETTIVLEAPYIGNTDRLDSFDVTVVEQLAEVFPNRSPAPPECLVLPEGSDSRVLAVAVDERIDVSPIVRFNLCWTTSSGADS